jgi:hypothetical protein
MIVVAPDPSLDEIYPIAGIDWGGLLIVRSLFYVTHFVGTEIEPDESKDIRVFMQGLEDRRMVDILCKEHVVLDDVNEFSLNPVHGILDIIGKINRSIARQDGSVDHGERRRDGDEIRSYDHSGVVAGKSCFDGFFGRLLVAQRMLHRGE